MLCPRNVKVASRLAGIGSWLRNEKHEHSTSELVAARRATFWQSPTAWGAARVAVGIRARLRSRAGCAGHRSRVAAAFHSSAIVGLVDADAFRCSEHRASNLFAPGARASGPVRAALPSR